MIRPFIIVPIALWLSGCAGLLPMVGYDKDGNPTMARVREERFSERLAEGMVSVQDSVVPALNKQDATEKKWQLRTAVVGFGAKVEAGIGPFSVGIKPRIRAAFTTGDKAPIP